MRFLESTQTKDFYMHNVRTKPNVRTKAYIQLKEEKQNMYSKETTKQNA